MFTDQPFIPRQQQPRPRRRSSRMHPGWAAFFLAWFSGIFTILAMFATVQWAAFKLPIGYVILTGGMAFLLFAIGGRKAERLDDTRTNGHA